MLQEGESSDSLGSYSSSILPFISDSSCSTYMTVGAAKTTSPPQEALSIFNYWSCSSTATASVLSFERGDQQEDDCAAWIDATDQNYSQLISSRVLDSRRRTNHSSRLIQDRDCFEVESGSCAGLLQSPVREKQQSYQGRFGLIYPAVAPAVDGVRESIGRTASALQKRQYTDACDDMPSPKKQCGNTRKTKDKSSPSKDPQSIAAKNRRERISERLKILQDLVPNGTKVDLVTMLEKAISYVKFLQLQVKVLATDEFWPAQGGKAPDISQVKEAIDAVLSSQRDRNSCSKH